MIIIIFIPEEHQSECHTSPLWSAEACYQYSKWNRIDSNFAMELFPGYWVQIMTNQYQNVNFCVTPAPAPRNTSNTNEDKNSLTNILAVRTCWKSKCWNNGDWSSLRSLLIHHYPPKIIIFCTNIPSAPDIIIVKYWNKTSSLI